MKRKYWFQIIASIGVIPLFFYWVGKAKQFNLEEHNQFTRQLLKIKQRYAILNQDILQSKYKIIQSYDSLVNEIYDLYKLQHQLLDVPSFIELEGQRRIQKNLQLQGQKIKSIDELLERFKSHHSVLQNSLSYFPPLTAETIELISERSLDRDLEIQLNLLVNNISLYQSRTKLETKREIIKGIQFISEYRELDIEPELRSQLDTLVKHAQVILKNQEKVDALVRDILDMPTLELSDDLSLLYDFYYAKAIEHSNRYRFYTYVLSIIILCSISYLMMNQLAKAREAALEGSRLKSQFLANMSHEIRTPMNGILGIAELLLNTPLSQEQRESIETLQDSADNLLTIINDILDLSKIEAREMHLDMLEFSLETCLDRVVSLLKNRALEKSLKLEVSIDPAVPKRLVGDVSRLRQILMNLLGNAIKFTPSGKVEVCVSSHHQSDSKVTSTDGELAKKIHLKFQVCDTGIGIREEDLPKLFQVFSQVDASTSREHGGTGLGLAICQKLVGLMGGEIGVESQKNQGSIFWFTATFLQPATLGVATGKESECELPAPKTLELAGEGQTSWAKSNGVAGLEEVRKTQDAKDAIKILVVEDNPINRKVLLRQLQLLGYRADVATNGRDAIEQLKHHDRDLVFMDCQMPILDGYDATRELRRYECQTRHTVVIALTAHAMKGDREKCLDAGMDDYLTKPVNLETLNAKLNHWTRDLQSIPSVPVSLPPKPEPNLIDLHRLDEISDGDVEFQQELLEMFVTDITEKLAILQQALQEGDRSAIVHQAHTIKGASANLGITSICELARELEHQARDDRLWEPQKQLTQIDRILDRVKVWMTERKQ